MIKKYNFVLFGVKEATGILATLLSKHGIQVDLVISIEPFIATQNHIADFQDLRHVAAAIGADYHCVSDYSLKTGTEAFFNQHQFTLGIVYGWQRLIPQSVIQKFKQGLFGFHASPEHLPHGRGRSPLNWSIILEKKIGYNHCFKYVAAADAGDVFSISPFEITAYDTIRTLMYKSLLIAEQDILKLIENIKTAKLVLKSQHGTPTFLPKRTPEDGLLDFKTQSTKALIALIRAVTKPFPGAYCFTQDGKKITIWEAWPFDKLMDFSAYQAGEVIANLYDMPLVKTIDGSIYIKQYEGQLLQSHELLSVFSTRPGVI